MISREVADRIRRRQRELLGAVGLLKERSSREGHGELLPDIESLRETLEDHVGLVQAVLEAVTEDDIAPRS